MTVMVDELQAWPARARTAQARRHFGEGKLSCHLTCDGPIEELHALASAIGLRRAWFQDHPIAPHYDLTPARREAALSFGAIFVSRREQARRRRELRAFPSSVMPAPRIPPRADDANLPPEPREHDEHEPEEAPTGDPGGAPPEPSFSNLLVAPTLADLGRTMTEMVSAPERMRWHASPLPPLPPWLLKRDH